MTTTHIAGIRLIVCGRVIQRCSLCGWKLCDSNRSAMAVMPGSSNSEFPTWETGRLVRVHDGVPEHWELLDDSDKLPDDSCLSLVED